MNIMSFASNFNYILNERITDDSYVKAINLIKQELVNFSNITHESNDEKIYRIYSLSNPIKTEFGLVEELYFTIIDPIKDSRWKRKQGEVTPDGKEVILFPSPVEFKKLKQQNEHPLLFLLSGYTMDNAITHELTHALNKLRSRGIKWPAKGKEQFDTDSIDYERSTEEMQARIVPIIADIKRKIQDKRSREGKQFATLVMNRDVHGFVDAVLSRYGHDLYFGRLDSKTKQRYIKRLTDIFQTL